METAHGFAAPAVSALARGIREYSLFQAVLLVMDRLRQEYPGLGDEALYDQLEFQANPSLGFPGSDVDRVEFFEERGMLRARLRFNLIGLFGASSPLPAFYSEQALGDSEEGNPTRNFLDLFHHLSLIHISPTAAPCCPANRACAPRCCNGNSSSNTAMKMCIRDRHR